MIHDTAEVKTKNIGEKTTIWQYVVIMDKAEVGKNCNINAHVFIENDVIIDNNVTIKSGVQLWNGLRVHDNVFIGPNVTFANDKNPRSKQYPRSFQKTIIHNHASIGAGAIILGGFEIGAFAMVGAGALVTKDVPERALVIGNPAKVMGWVNDDGSRMDIKGDGMWIDINGRKWIQKNNRLVEV